MIVIDGRQSEIELKNFENLEQVIERIMEDGHLENRVVTDVFVDGEPFSEIYPHQAEDIETGDIEKLELRSVGVVQLADDIAGELGKVITLMGKGGKEVAILFRQADDAEALETYQDLLDVTRSFLGMVNLLREEFSFGQFPEFLHAAQEMDTLFTEMSEVLAGEDWILLADLLEYEFLPVVEKWEAVVDRLRTDIDAAKG